MDVVRIRIAELDPAGFRHEARAALDVYVAAMGYSPRVTWQRSPIWHEHSTWAGFTAVAAFAPASEAEEEAHIAPLGSDRRGNRSNGKAEGSANGSAGSSRSAGRHSTRRAFRWALPRRAEAEPDPAPAESAAAAAAAAPAIDADEPERLVGIGYGYRAVPGQWWYDRVAAGAAAAHVELPGLAAELTELHVHPNLHGNGIGTRLLSAFLDTRTEPSVLLSTPEVDGEANNAWRLYRRMGFQDVLRDFLFEGDPRRFGVLRADLHDTGDTASEGLGG